LSALVAVALLISATQAHASPLNSTGAIILTPFDNFFSSFSTFMTGTVARVGSLAAIVICGITYATGEPGAKKMAVGTAIGVGIANMAASCLTWFST
jgi:type IV secretory pathway VirB2 component (pilin)